MYLRVPPHQVPAPDEWIAEMATQRTTHHMPRAPFSLSLPQPASVLQSPAVRTGTLMATFGVLLGIGVVVLEEQQGVAFGIGLLIGMVMLPWLLALLSSPSHLLLPPGGMCALILGTGVEVALAGLYSGRVIPLLSGLALAVGSLTIWIASSVMKR